MKILLKAQSELEQSGQCDIDFHTPVLELEKFDSSTLVRVDHVAMVSSVRSNPSQEPTAEFWYVDISAIDTRFGQIVNAQLLFGEEAPSRARKGIQFNDVIVSTCRPTRGAVALVPETLDGQVCSTAFTVLQAKPALVLPAYLRWALHLSSTREQFRKWSTGSSYPAILDEDVEKTIIPVPDLDVQKAIVARIDTVLLRQQRVTALAERTWCREMEKLEATILTRG